MFQASQERGGGVRYEEDPGSILGAASRMLMRKEFFGLGIV
jgi:hypothetical protein